MSFSIGAIEAVTNGETVYAALSPYLDGAVRTSDATALAHADAVAQAPDVNVTQTVIVANGDSAPVATVVPPFANPAIAAIGERLAISEALAATTSIPTNVTVNAASEPSSIVQSYGAVALLAGVQAAPPVYGLPAIPVIAPVAKIALPIARKVA